MDNLVVNDKDALVMKLMHYFVTEENYTPVLVNGVKNEIWLENTEAYYKIIRINSNYIHNDEQFDFDIFKTKKIVAQIKRKTLSWKVRTINILLDLNEDVEVTEAKNISTFVVNSIDDVKSDKSLGSIFPNIKNDPLNNEEGIDLLLSATHDINVKTEKKNKDYEEVFKEKKIVITYVLMAINILMFVLTYVVYFATNGSIDLYSLLALDSTAVKSGEIWRLITGTFLHVGPLYLPLHLLFNMYALYTIGSQIENFLGKTKFILIYLASAIMGSLLSCLFLQGISVGASGAIFGLMGSLAYFGYHYRVYFGNVLKTQIIPLICLNLLLGFYSEGIDNFAHIGGLIGGVLSTMALGIENKDNTVERINGIIVYILLLAFLCFMIFK